ncbi:DUF350 domain-containing protein [Exiguobacterium algae]|uniref:DUF350 domain-containing protein n=1 Tax=Exiguobacterium algae TaxID=2751250 RepID=UPI001BE6DD2C|nr:DUF350 domain-containing protein [Exiguobacterium algae]
MGTVSFNVMLESLGLYTIAGLMIVVGLAIFEVTTPYSNWREIQKGNIAVALATGGKIVGLANIFRVVESHNDAAFDVIAGGGFGFLLLLATYWLFEFLTPTLKVNDEIQKGNIAVGLLAFLLSLGVSLVVGAALVR